MPSDVAGRLILASEEDPERERRPQSALARSRGDMVVSTNQLDGAMLRAAGATVAHMRVGAALR